MRYESDTSLCVCSLSKRVGYSLALRFVRHWRCRSLLDRPSSFSPTLKCELFHSVLLFSSPTERMMNTFMLFHTSWPYITLPRSRYAWSAFHSNPSLEHSNNAIPVISSAPRKAWASILILFCIHQYHVATAVRPGGAAPDLRLASVAECCLLPLSCASLFPFSVLVVKSNLRMQVVSGASKVLAGVNADIRYASVLKVEADC